VRQIQRRRAEVANDLLDRCKLACNRIAAGIAALRAGSSVEQAGAWVLQADPLTAVIAGRLRTALF